METPTSIDGLQYTDAPCSKALHARCRMRSNPELWFRDSPIEQRELELLAAAPASFLTNGNKSNYLRKVYHQKKGERFGMTDWKVEQDVECKKMIASAGARLIGYDFEIDNTVEWNSMCVNVNVTSNGGAMFDWGYLTTRPSKIRIFKGPPETCELHPWDAMILRDCTPNTETLYEIEEVASRRWDILVMKECEDSDFPWIVAAIKDAGAASDLPPSTCAGT